MTFGRSFTHAVAVLLGAGEPETQTTPEERAQLVHHLGNAKTIVEIGVFEGATTALLGAHADEAARIYGIDPFFPGRFGVCWSEVIANHVTREARAKGRVIMVKKLSHEAGPDVPGKIDFMFIDGDHSIEGITRDWHVWSPRIRAGGIIALHDSFAAPSSPSPLGSHAFFASTIAKHYDFSLVAQEGSLAVLRRK